MTLPAPLPPEEDQRLQRLLALGVLDTEAEPLFDALARAAALVAEAPIALVSLVDAQRQWFKANVGLEGTHETPRDIALCAHTILNDDVFVVPDATRDPRFADNPLVNGAPDIRFYAGAPITLQDGLRMGSLCVIDHQPRQFDARQRDILRQLARAAAEALDQRALAIERNAALQRETDVATLRNEDRLRLASTLEASEAGAWEWNMQTGELRFNEQWARIAGRRVDGPMRMFVASLDELRARTVDVQLIHPDDRDRFTAKLQRHLDGKDSLLSIETRVCRESGEWFWGLMRGRVIHWSDDGHPMWMYGTLLDISERKEIERRLHESEAFLERTGRVAGVGGWQVDLIRQEIRWSDQTCALHDMPTGHRPSYAEAESFFDPEARDRLREAIARAVADGSGWDIELPLITAKGRATWVRMVGVVEQENGTPVRLVGALQDITFRKRATEALELSERRFRRLFEESRGLICTHDLDGILLSVNPAAASALGYSIAQLLGRSMKDFVQPTTQTQFDDYLVRVANEGHASGLLRLVASDGRLLTWEYHNTLDTEGTEPYVLGHASDITERQRYENQLREWGLRDPLTGLFNRRYLDEFATTLPDEQICGCIVVDLDHFKQVNDTFGHQRGDEVLVAMGRFLSRHVRPSDIVVRIGGDEFLVLLPETSESQTDTLAQAMHADRHEAPIGFSLGIAVRRSGMSLDSALAEADQALYKHRRETRLPSR